MLAHGVSTCVTAASGASKARSVKATARRDERQRGGGSGNARRQNFTAPQRLLGHTPGQADPQEPRKDTVYTVRLSTGQRRGSALSDPTAGILVCLLSEDGSALLHRVPRLNDPETTEQEVQAICSSIDDQEAGADCSLALYAAATQRLSGQAPPRLRFQEGAVDEVSFCAPEMGPLAALLVGPEQGSWVCEEVDVSSSRTGHTDRFVCRESLGEGGEEPAAYLRPIPPGAVVYGSGDNAIIVTKAQASQLHRMNMQQYRELKAQLVAATAVLVGLGSGLAYAAGGRDLALPFALGGASGVLYQYMLQVAVDNVGGRSAYGQEQGAGRAEGRAEGSNDWGHIGVVLGNPAVRVMLGAGALLATFASLQAMTESGESYQAFVTTRGIVAALVGFLCYKAAVVGVAIIPPPVDDLGMPLAPDGSQARRIDRTRD